MIMIAVSPIETAHRNLQSLLREYRGDAIHTRIDLYVAKFSGGKTLTDYLADTEVKDDQKIRLLQTLSAIITQCDWSRLPEIEKMATDRANGGSHPDIEPEDDTRFSAAQIKAIARLEARAELADVLERVAKVLRETWVVGYFEKRLA